MGRKEETGIGARAVEGEERGRKERRYQEAGQIAGSGS